ncbi:related to endoglucanase IV precursor [Ramularia collo-cygni]|uniref:Related to endoglucanase IV n=1 Tax=Ramularia collo-cygni TaxID=112498 RepID=A0A2D3VAB0_9PEZI|nr:related to endoglucanase IV precursor [Ramularia collo-cygni]CZT23880.1 related to endoglucanase IV precursor [Ramularia collo-cygni]
MHSLALISTFIASASAHGLVQGIVASGTYYFGYNPNFQYRNPIPLVAGWSAPEDIDNGFIDPTKFSSPDIICHRSATPAGIAAKISAGDVVEMQWTDWPESHHGPVLDYIAKCPGDSCVDIDKTKLEFVKISEKGMNEWETSPGKWASDELIANNNSWSIKIPPSLKKGSYVLRHEIISLHSADHPKGAQNYPQCINLDITTSTGTIDLSSTNDGIPAMQFYDARDAGIFINIYESKSTYQIPGPTLWSGVGDSLARQTPVRIESYAPWVTGSSTSSLPQEEYSPQSTGYASMIFSGGEKGTSTTFVSYKSPSSSSSSSSTKTCTTTTTAPTTTTNSASSTLYSETLQALIDTLPPGALTKTMEVPSVTGTSQGKGNGRLPAKDLPKGWTLGELLQWVQWSVDNKAWKGEEGRRGGRGGGGKHARDFSF